MNPGEIPSHRTGRLSFQGPWIADYALRTVPSPRRVFVLLHGYTQSYHAIFPKLDPVLPRDCAVVALNAPFPIPQKLEDGSGYRAGYSWYFYDDKKDEYLIDMSIGIAFVAAALRELGLADLPKTLIGFSQGGYLAPFAAPALGSVDQVIAVGARYVDEELREVPGFRLDAVHGELDSVVGMAASRESWERLRDRGARGEYRVVSGEGHRMSKGVIEAVIDLVGK
jgi:predicted esterase